MRIDQVLHWLCLVKSRSLAGRACREGRVLLDGQPVRPSHAVHSGDRLVLLNPTRTQATHVRLREVPERQCSRKDAGAFYHTDRVETLDGHDLTWHVTPENEDA